MVDFLGVVRPAEQDRLITGIDYEAHPTMATHQLERISRLAMEKFGLHMAVIRHRVGFVPVGEASLLVRLAAPHRGEAIRALEWLIDELKKKVPIWKRPQFASARSPDAAPSQDLTEVGQP